MLYPVQNTGFDADADADADHRRLTTVKRLIAAHGTDLADAADEPDEGR
jgi:hypothetical protein